MEENYPENPDKIEFYKRRDKIKDQLDTIYYFLSKVGQERVQDDFKNIELRRIYRRIPDWRLRQLKKKRSYP